MLNFTEIGSVLELRKAGNKNAYANMLKNALTKKKKYSSGVLCSLK